MGFSMGAILWVLFTVPATITETMKRADLGQKKVAPKKKVEEVKEALDDEASGASINEVSSLLSTQKIEQAIIKRAVEQEVQDANAQDED